MRIELTVLIWLMLLAASMWIPYIVGVNTDPVKRDAFTRPGDNSVLRPWVQRANRAHLNLLEQAVPFAVLTLLADRAMAFSALTAWTSIAFLILRLVHAVGMISGVARMPLRPLIFTGGWICCLLMGFAALTA